MKAKFTISNSQPNMADAGVRARTASGKNVPQYKRLQGFSTEISFHTHLPMEPAHHLSANLMEKKHLDY